MCRHRATAATSATTSASTSTATEQPEYLMQCALRILFAADLFILFSSVDTQCGGPVHAATWRMAAVATQLQ